MDHLEAERAAEAQERVAAPANKPPVPALGSASATPTTTSSAGTSTSPSASASPSASSSAKPSASSSAAPSSSGSASPQPTAVPVADRSVPVVVLNATKRTGLAAAVAKQLRAKGWDVVSVANWRGREVRLTTVFVTGNKEAAATMRRDVPAANGTLPTWSGMSRNRVVLVVADDYPRVG
ncbi:MAG: LytR C-terminal domain-containing protein [Candidatus Nanopelagicales bacterium]